MKKTNKEKMKTLRLIEASEDVTLQPHSDNQKKTSDDIQERVSRLIDKWEAEDWKHELESMDVDKLDEDEDIDYEWGNNTRH
jgi:hypothetical protein